MFYRMDTPITEQVASDVVQNAEKLVGRLDRTAGSFDGSSSYAATKKALHIANFEPRHRTVMIATMSQLLRTYA